MNDLRNKPIRLKIVFGITWILGIGGYIISGLQFVSPLDNFPRAMGQLIGILIILSPGIAALYWGRK